VQAHPADPLLDRLIDRDHTIDRFDATYLDDLPRILREQHGITADNATTHARWPELAELWRLAGRDEIDFDLAELPRALAAAGVDPRRHTPQHAQQQTKHRMRYDNVRAWRKTANRSVDEVGPELVNELQVEYSRQSGGSHEWEFMDLARPETGDPWTSFIRDLVKRGVIAADEPALTIGPRWTGEIVYFREQLGLENAIGLDLFSNDESLVKVGDMHDMPFRDNTFALVYQRNTFNKSYDIRKALEECVRVLRDGGVLVTDDCYDYTDGVSELARTNIKHNDGVLRVLDRHAGEVLYDREEDSREDWIARVGQLAVKIKK
jgi:SAM-dependent methyltransferase